ncbi:hypothetical protein F4604DRAFT_1901266 [Suillus subluteus]|nr:hypothetical protein F4604DRAFT_1901266 [Suillus subluteus]
MKGFLSLVLVSIALLQMTAAAPTVSEGFQAVEKREGTQNVEKRAWIGSYAQTLSMTTMKFLMTPKPKVIIEALGRLASPRPLAVVWVVPLRTKSCRSSKLSRSNNYQNPTTFLSMYCSVIKQRATTLIAPHPNTRYSASDARYSASDARDHSNTGLLMITSDQYANLQALNFNIGGTSYGLTPNGQIWPRSLNSDIGGSSNNIYLVVNDIGSNSGTGLDFINGYSFLQRFYSVFDTTNHQVGFATTSSTSAVSN